MAFSAKVLCDSLHPWGCSRLTTMELTYPLIIHGEFMTHRMFSRNAASSRAIPTKKILQRVLDDPFTPLEWGVDIPGMVAGAAHSDPEACQAWWDGARAGAYNQAVRGLELGLHKQVVNRIVAPFMWITVIASGVDHAWENFFNLRCAPDAEPHIHHVALMARDVYDASQPKPLWKYSPLSDYRYTTHLPLMGFPGDEDLTGEEAKKVCVGRCARVSYLTHAGVRDVAADIELYNRLMKAPHASPFEHAAVPAYPPHVLKVSNFGPYWAQHRKEVPHEYCTKAPRPKPNFC